MERVNSLAGFPIDPSQFVAVLIGESSPGQRHIGIWHIADDNGNESQRDYVRKPGVGRRNDGLPWEPCAIEFINPKGVVSVRRAAGTQPHWGWRNGRGTVPQRRCSYLASTLG